MTTIEIAVQDAAGARIARQEGADRVELCVALGATGGLTPSVGLVRACATGVDAVHLSAKTTVLSEGGPGGGGAAPIEVTDRATVRAAVAAAHAA